MYKIYLKKEDNFKSGDEFLAHSKLLLENDIKILPPIKIVYEDEYSFIYTQYKCERIDKNNKLYYVEYIKDIKSNVRQTNTFS